jgi:hypothetical protein
MMTNQRQTRLCEILTTEANNLTYFQAAWMKRQLTGKATGNMHGVVDKATLATRGLTPQQATALETAVEKALETMMANQEGWAILGMGDELTTYIVKQQQQHAYGTSENGLIGCDGGLKFGRNYDGTRARPRADWCVSDGASRIWMKGKLEGDQCYDTAT